MKIRKAYLIALFVLVAVPSVFFIAGQLRRRGILPELMGVNEYSARGPCPTCGEMVTGRLMDWIGDDGGNLFFSAKCDACGIHLGAGAKTDRNNASWITSNAKNNTEPDGP
jgi:hypothetical protein